MFVTMMFDLTIGADTHYICFSSMNKGYSGIKEGRKIERKSKDHGKKERNRKKVKVKSCVCSRNVLGEIQVCELGDEKAFFELLKPSTTETV